VWNTIWIDVNMSECMLFKGSTIDILESTNFLALAVHLNFSEFPSKVHIDTSLGAFFKRYLVGISEFVDLFVWSIVCDSSRLA